MLRSCRQWLIPALSLGCSVAFAGPPAGAPADATGLCGDGGYTVRPERKGACRGRQGVQDWWGPSVPGAARGASASASAPAGAASSPK